MILAAEIGRISDATHRSLSAWMGAIPMISSSSTASDRGKLAVIRVASGLRQCSDVSNVLVVFILVWPLTYDLWRLGANRQRRWTQADTNRLLRFCFRVHCDVYKASVCLVRQHDAETPAVVQLRLFVVSCSLLGAKKTCYEREFTVVSKSWKAIRRHC